MLHMVSYPHRGKSGHISCYLNRTFDVLPTPTTTPIDAAPRFVLKCAYTGKEVVG